jgi:hemolysin III
MAPRAPLTGRIGARAVARVAVRPTLQEERASAIVHFIGALLSMLAAISLLLVPPMRASATMIASCIVFCLAVVVTMGVSTAHHASRCARRKRIFLAYDHAAIGVMIAGSWSAFAIVALPASELPPLLIGLWLAAAIVVAQQLICLRRGCEPWLERHSAALFLGMGWVPALLYGGAILRALPYDSAVLLVAGCVVYTCGVVPYGARRFHFHHATWHFFTVAAAVLHFFALRAALA